MNKEKFERLRYVGPASSFCVMSAATADQEPIGKERSLVTGTIYNDLPPDHPVIKNLITAKLLVAPPEDEATEASPDPAVSDSANAKTGDDKKPKPNKTTDNSKGASK